MVTRMSSPLEELPIASLLTIALMDLLTTVPLSSHPHD
jgi:hypothetical protein